MTDVPWFTTVAGEDFEQGDLFLNCPVPSVSHVTFPLEDEGYATVEVKSLDVVVLTQTCDLVHDKVSDVLLAAVAAVDDVLPHDLNGKERRSFRKKLVNDTLPQYSLLHRVAGEAPAIPWSVVNFHHLYGVPKEYLRAFVRTQPSRLRLVPPYREHLAQAFARYFMRVGLPHDAQPFIEDDDAPGVVVPPVRRGHGGRR